MKAKIKQTRFPSEICYVNLLLNSNITSLITSSTRSFTSPPPMCAMLCLVAQSCLTLCDPMDCSLPGFSVHESFQARMLEWIAIFFLRGIFPTQGSNSSLLCLLHRRWILYLLSHQGSPFKVYFWFYTVLSNDNSSSHLHQVLLTLAQYPA